MISVYVGKPGAGKSYAAVCAAVAVLARGGHVATNLPLDMPAALAYAGGLRPLPRWKRRVLTALRLPIERFTPKPRPIDPSTLTIHPDAELATPAFWDAVAIRSASLRSRAGCTVVIDEAAAWVRAVRDLTPSQQSTILAALERHRQSYLNVIFLCQNHLQLDPLKSIKRLVHLWSDVVNLRETLHLPFYQRTVYDSWYAPNGTERLVLDTRRGRYLPEVFEIYRSHAYAPTTSPSDSLELGVESSVSDNRGGLRAVKWYIIGALLIVFGLYFAGDAISFSGIRDSFIGHWLPSFSPDRASDTLNRTSRSSTPAVSSSTSDAFYVLVAPDPVGFRLGSCRLPVPAFCRTRPHGSWLYLVCPPAAARDLSSTLRARRCSFSSAAAPPPPRAAGGVAARPLDR